MRKRCPVPGWCRIDTEIAIASIQALPSPDVADGIAAAIGVPPPAPNRFSVGEDITLAAIAPNEWLLIGAPACLQPAMHRITGALGADAVLAVDVTHGTLALRLEGELATACVAAYSGRDLRAQATPVGAAVRTRFGDIRVMLACTDPKPGYLILSNQSYSDYLLHLIGQIESPA